MNLAKESRMRRLSITAMLLAAALPALPAGAQQKQPPHAWLFGTWTGGLFPVPRNISAEACLSQPVVIFTRDLVIRATLTSQMLTQRVIETANVSPAGVAFRFAPAGSGAGGVLGLAGSAQPAGFGCASQDALQVLRKGPNEITFPDCKDFPEPLVRCPSR
jgi:hypothetical protein